MTGLYMASSKNVRLHIGGMVNGKPQAICSLPAYLNGGKVPAVRDMRGILEGRSIVAASKWTEVDGTAFDAIGFAVTSANCAFDEGGDLLAEVNAHRENVIDTLRENDRSHLQAKALAAFDARIAELAPALYAAEGVTVERESSAGSNGALVDVERVTLDGGVIGHVFAAVNRGRVEFKAQTLGGELAAWNSDFTGAVRALVAHARHAAAVTASQAKTGPHEEAYNLGSTDALRNAQHAIDCALEQTDGAEVGASLVLDLPTVEQGYTFVMWATVNGQNMRNVLRADATDVKRLMAHWAGFVENVRAALAAPVDGMAEGFAQAVEQQRASLGQAAPVDGTAQGFMAWANNEMHRAAAKIMEVEPSAPVDPVAVLGDAVLLAAAAMAGFYKGHAPRPGDAVAHMVEVTRGEVRDAAYLYAMLASWAEVLRTVPIAEAFGAWMYYEMDAGRVPTSDACQAFISTKE
jgi:hypothetical protein